MTQGYLGSRVVAWITHKLTKPLREFTNVYLPEVAGHTSLRETALAGRRSEKRPLLGTRPVHQSIRNLTYLAIPACAALLVLQETRAQSPASVDTLIYSDSATAIIVELARARHQAQSLRLAGYRSRVFTRLEGHVGASRYGPGWTVFKYETAARMHWTRNGDLRVDIEGGRMAGTRMPGFGRDQMASFFEDIFGGDVWFIPSTVGDDIEIMGLPEAEALHPLARGAEHFYRYEITDSMRIVFPHRTVRILSLRVDPRVTHAYVVSEIGVDQPLRWRREARSLIAGRLWIDADSLDVVRLTGAFVGEGIWDEEDDAPRLVNLEADIEYSLHQNRYWLPHRQVLTVHWVFKYMPGADLVGSGITTFSDHEVDISPSPIAFNHERFDFDTTGYRSHYSGGRGSAVRYGTWHCPDAWEFERDSSDPRCGSRATTSTGINPDGTVWEVNLPTLDSLRNHEFGEDWRETIDLAGNEFLDNAVREIAKIGTTSPAVHAFARQPGGLDWKHVYNAIGFNRVQGLSLGGGYQLNLWPTYTTLHLNARYGSSDRHLLGSGTWRRDAPEGRFEFTAFRAVQDVEPWTNGTGIGNSLKALALGHDDADYYLAPFGFGISFRGYSGSFADGYASLILERQETMSNVSSSFVAGDLQMNPPIADGDYVRGTLSKTWHPGFSGTTSLTLGAQGLASEDSLSARFWSTALLPYASGNTIASLRIHGGVVAGHRLPQMSYRVGGPSTVRGYDYGLETGRTFWSVQGDIEWVVSQWWSPVVFADLGGIDFSGTPLVGVGVGLSLLSGWTRIDLARGMTMGGGYRLDVLLGIPIS